MTRASPGAISLLTSFRNLDDILSGPEALLGSRLFRSFFTPAVLITISGIRVERGPMSFGVRPSGFEKTLEN